MWRRCAMIRCSGDAGNRGLRDVEAGNPPRGEQDIASRALDAGVTEVGGTRDSCDGDLGSILIRDIHLHDWQGRMTRGCAP